MVAGGGTVVGRWRDGGRAVVGSGGGGGWGGAGRCSFTSSGGFFFRGGQFANVPCRWSRRVHRFGPPRLCRLVMEGIGRLLGPGWSPGRSHGWSLVRWWVGPSNHWL